MYISYSPSNNDLWVFQDNGDHYKSLRDFYMEVRSKTKMNTHEIAKIADIDHARLYYVENTHNVTGKPSNSIPVILAALEVLGYAVLIIVFTFLLIIKFHECHPVRLLSFT